MAEAHPTSVIATEVQFGHGSRRDPCQCDIDVLRQEINDLRTTLEVVVKDIEGLKRVKIEAAALCIPAPGIQVKSEPLEAALEADQEEVPAPAGSEDALNHEQVEVMREEEVQMEVDGRPEANLQDTGDAGGQVTSVPPRQQTTEEPTWITPPCGEVIFRVNPEYARRTARTNAVVATPVQVPTPPPQPREETPPPPPSPPLVPVVRPAKAIGIIPASQAKRKQNFELIIEVPAKRFKTSNYITQNSSSGSSAASTSRTTLDASSSTAATLAPAKWARAPHKNPIFRRNLGTPFVVDLNPKIRDVAVTRDFMRSYFGAHMRCTISQPSKEHLDKHGYDHFVFINETSTPQPPSAPGEPCLITLFEDRPWPVYDYYRIFGRVRPSKWQYMGLYKATKLPAWTPTEIKRQQTTVKRYWATTVRESKWARPMLARILLRKELGRQPTKAEISDQVKKIGNKLVPSPTSNLVIAAFENGEEKLYPWKLECEDYEENLQWEIAITSPRHKDKETKKSNFPVET